MGHDHQLRADVELTSHVLLRTPKLVRKGIVVCFNPPIRGETLPNRAEPKSIYIALSEVNT